MPTIRTAITELLGIQHPICSGGMTATGSASLAAAVSNAGGLGMLTCLHCRTPERLNKEIARTRQLTRLPFGVNLTILGEKRGEPEYPDEFVQVICKNNIRIVETCGGGIVLMQRLHDALRTGGVEIIISKCVQVKHAVTAQNKLGADVISLMGFDSGGLPGEVDVGIFVQMALAKQSLRIPFLVSGGVVTGSQLVAALALGAGGVQIGRSGFLSTLPILFPLIKVAHATGTRFNATKECDMFPPSFKKKMVEAGVKSTSIVMRPFRASSRVLLNEDAKKVLEIEKKKGSSIIFKDIGPLVKFDRLREGMETNDANRGIWNCGQGVALINDVPTCQVVVKRIIREAEEVMSGLQPLFISNTSRL